MDNLRFDAFRHKTMIAYLVFLLGGLGYWLTNQFPFFTPIDLPLTFVDLVVPFVPWTLLVYLAIIPLLIVLPFLINSRPMFWRAMIAAGFLAILNLGFFIFLPTHYPIRQDLIAQNHSPFWRCGPTRRFMRLIQKQIAFPAFMSAFPLSMR